MLLLWLPIGGESRLWAQGLRVQQAPTHANVSYGPHHRNVLDIWQVPSENPTPVVVYFHAGGFTGGDKGDLPAALLTACHRQGITVISVNYRFSTQAPYPGPMLDGARAIQFVRQQSQMWNLDPARVLVSGRSAGAAMALWLAFHSDMAKPDAEQPIERFSTRVQGVAVVGAQTTLDPREISHWISPATAHHPAFALLFDIPADEILSDRADRQYRAASAINHVTPDDPPAFLFYSDLSREVPSEAPAGTGVHHPAFGFHLKDKMDPMGIECQVKLADDFGNDYAQMFDAMANFLARQVSSSVSER